MKENRTWETERPKKGLERRKGVGVNLRKWPRAREKTLKKLSN
jgi:hypothetical protein